MKSFFETVGFYCLNKYFGPFLQKIKIIKIKIFKANREFVQIRPKGKL